MTKKTLKLGEAAWIIGNILCAFGNRLTINSAFGAASIVAPALTLSHKIPGENVYAICEYIIQGLLLALCCILIGKFKGKFIATICNIIFYGACSFMFEKIFSFLTPSDIGIRILIATIGTLITSFAVALMLRTYIPPSAYEIFVREVAEAKKFNVNKMKLVFDASMLALTVVMMFTLLGGFYVDIIGPLTIITAFMNSVLIGFFGKLLDKYCDFSPAIPKLYEILNPKTK